MKKAGMTNEQLATKLGKSERWVRHQRSGTKPWSKQFEQDLEKVSGQGN